MSSSFDGWKLTVLPPFFVIDGQLCSGSSATTIVSSSSGRSSGNAEEQDEEAGIWRELQSLSSGSRPSRSVRFGYFHGVCVHAEAGPSSQKGLRIVGGWCGNGQGDQIGHPWSVGAQRQRWCLWIWGCPGVQSRCHRLHTGERTFELVQSPAQGARALTGRGLWFLIDFMLFRMRKLVLPKGNCNILQFFKLGSL